MLPASAFAAPIIGTDALRAWNLVVLGDLSSDSEVEGRTFVGGNLSGNSSNYGIKPLTPSSFSQPGLTVVGNVVGNTKNLNFGSGAIIGGNVDSGFNLNGDPQTVKVGGTIKNTNVNQNTVTSGIATNDPSFRVDLQQQASLLTTSLTGLSENMAKLTGNSSFTIANNRGTFTAQPDADGVAVFNISGDDLKKIGEIKFNLNGADTAIVNVSGSSIMLDDNFIGGTANLGKNIIWNFSEADTLRVKTAWGGSVLAPKANANISNYIEGSAVFGNLVQHGELHISTYEGNYFPPTTPPDDTTPSPVPEPGTIGMFLLAAAGLLFGRKWLLRRTAAASATRTTPGRPA